MSTHRSLRVSLVAVNIANFHCLLLCDSSTIAHLEPHPEQEIIDTELGNRDPFRWPTKMLHEPPEGLPLFRSAHFLVDEDTARHLYTNIRFESAVGVAPSQPPSREPYPDEDPNLPPGAIAIRRIAFEGLCTDLDPDDYMHLDYMDNCCFRSLAPSEHAQAMASHDAFWLKLQCKSRGRDSPAGTATKYREH